VRIIVLVDGEHHPSAVRSALDALRSEGDEIVGAVYCGGGEKVEVSRIDDAYGVPVARGEDLGRELSDAIGAWKGELVLDLTDHPVLTAADRFQLAAVALGRGVPYRGADFDLRPPRFERVLTKPSVRVFATGKRTGKTAVAAALARRAVGRGLEPVIVAVGRGGPHPPRVIESGTRLDVRVLLELADAGYHAGSDYVEDALTAGVTTIGCVRVGGGLAGATVYSNVVDAARIAEDRSENLVILEGSGASLPDVDADVGVICVPAEIERSELYDYLGPYRLLLADLAVVTMAEEASAAADAEAAIRGTVPDLDVVHVAFRPEPLESVSGRRVFLCTTAPVAAGPVLVRHLEQVHGCEVVGISDRLADRTALRNELENAPGYDVLLTELKAAAVDVAGRHAVRAGKDVVFLNNALVGNGIGEAFDRVLDRAIERSMG
jgi:cyclic 2,3-diphosphoglycerate synthetase